MGNYLSKTKIEWCDRVWNPAFGCLKKPPCEYCYARKIAKRFYKKIADAEFEYRKENDFEITPLLKSLLRAKIKYFKPVLLLKNYYKSFPKKSSRIFVNSMSDIKWWDGFWMKAVMQKIGHYPQHDFLFLTKFPEVYFYYQPYRLNCWLGITITGQTDYLKMIEHPLYPFSNKRMTIEGIDALIKFISFEPLLENPFDSKYNYLKKFNWIIIGAQTNPYKPPKREWVEKIIEKAKENNIPVFLKDNLFKAYPDLPRLQEFP